MINIDAGKIMVSVIFLHVHVSLNLGRKIIVRYEKGIHKYRLFGLRDRLFGF